MIFLVKKEESNQTLISFLKNKLKSLPLNLIHKLFRKKKIEINDKCVRYYQNRIKFKDVIKINKNLSIETKYEEKLIKKPEKPKDFINLNINYEDDNIVIISKEHNVSMDNLDDNVKYYLHNKSIDRKYVTSSIHRLDKLTKGLIIYPKNKKTRTTLHNLISDKEKIIKEYLAICAKNNKKILPEFIDGFIKKDEKEKKMIFSFANEEEQKSKKCSMIIKELKQDNKIIFLKIILITGRKHQIRSILSYFNSPILGDKKYGSNLKLENKILLFAYKITFKNMPIFLSYLNNKSFSLKINKLSKLEI